MKYIPQFTTAVVAILLSASPLRAEPLTPDPDNLGWGKWPKHLKILGADQVNQTSYGTGGVEFGVIVRGTSENASSEVFVINRRPDFDAHVKIDTRDGILSGNCPRMTYRSLGTIDADITRTANKDVVITQGNWGRNTPLNGNEPKPNPQSSISQGDLKLIIKQLKSAPEDFVTEKLIERIFGKAIARNFGLLSALDSEVAGDGTMDTKVRQWRQRCEDFIEKEDERDALVKESLRIIRRCDQIMRTTRDPVQYAVALRTKENSARQGLEEAETAKRNFAARHWCENLLETIPTPRKSRP